MKKWLKRSGWGVLTLFILMNVIAILHAYSFTHFSTEHNTKTGSPEKLSFLEKAEAVIMGVKNPRPEIRRTPGNAYRTINIDHEGSNMECWLIKAVESKGTVVIFHGYGGDKSTMLDKANEFLELGYNAFLVDFLGSGGSDGNETTIGYKEADQVKSVHAYLKREGYANVFLFGTSLGAAATMKAVNDGLNPDGIILECPFGSLYLTVCARFKTMRLPSFPMAGLLVFWGGAINGFWAFDHNPEDYATNIHCPTLLMYGEQDKKVSIQEIKTIFKNLMGVKKLVTFPKAGHVNYLNGYAKEWSQHVRDFLDSANH